MGNHIPTICILVNAIPQVYTYSGKERGVHIDCAEWFYVTLIQTKVIGEEETSVKKMPL